MSLSAVVLLCGGPIFTFDFPVMVAVAVACLPVFFVTFEIRRWEGALFVLYCVGYAAHLMLGATKHDALGTYGPVFGAGTLSTSRSWPPRCFRSPGRLPPSHGSRECYVPRGSSPAGASFA